jgi:hypothetical protein
VVIDAVRCCKLALDHGVAGALTAPSSYFKKSPPVQYTDDEARRLTEEFIVKYGQAAARKSPARTAAQSGANGSKPSAQKLSLKRKGEKRATKTRNRTRTVTRKTALKA